jgi:phospholipid/cholesterol/gamma-HCH transport system permease protein
VIPEVIVKKLAQWIEISGLDGVIQASIVQPVTFTGALTQFIGNTLLRSFRPRMSIKLFMRQCEFVGNQSIGVMILAGMMIGAVFGLQFGEIFRIFGAEGMIGAAAGYALS